MPSSNSRQPLHEKRTRTKNLDLISEEVAKKRQGSSKQIPLLKDEENDAGLDLEYIPSISSVPVLQSSTPVLPKFARSRPRRAQPTMSSLPPSSPPPFSSSHSDQNWCDKVAKLPEPADEEDDLFGFMAAERKLKAQRIVKEGQTLNLRLPNLNEEATQEMDGSQEEEEGDGDDTFAYAFPTPPPRPRPRASQLSSASDVEATPFVPYHSPGQIPTPKKRTRKRKPLASPSSTVTSTISNASTPSPRKPSRTTPMLSKGLENTRHLEIANVNDARTARVKTRSRKAKAPEEDSIMTASKDLEALLPRRPVRRVATGTAIGNDEAKVRLRKVKEASTTRSKKKINGPEPKSKKGSKNKASRREGRNDAGEEFVLDAENDDSFSIARRERLEYYKKLESYEVEKENVYVV